MIRVVFCTVVHVALHPEALIAKRVPELFYDRVPLFVLDRRLDQNRQELLLSDFELIGGSSRNAGTKVFNFFFFEMQVLKYLTSYSTVISIKIDKS